MGHTLHWFAYVGQDPEFDYDLTNGYDSGKATTIEFSMVFTEGDTKIKSL